MVAPTSFFGHYGGHIRILEEVRVLQSWGHKVTVVTYFKGQDVPGVDIRRTAPLPWRADYEVGSSRHKIAFDVYLLAKTLRVALATRPDIIHGHMHEGSLIGGAVARLLGIPLVFDFQGSLTGEMLDHGFIKEGGLGWAVWRRIEWLASRLPKAVLISSLRAEKLLVNAFGVKPDRIFSLPDCADLDHFDRTKISEQTKAALRRRFGIPPGRVVVAYLGLLADYQGTPHLIKTAVKLKEMGKDIHFLIMGFPNEDKYAQIAERLGVGDRVTFTGRVNYVQDAPRFLALGDIAISAKYSATEGSGKVLNYMALGQPVVAYDTPVHREYLGEAGVYVPKGEIDGLAQAVAELAEDESRRIELGKRLRQRASERYSWLSAGRTIEDVYYKLVK